MSTAFAAHPTSCFDRGALPPARQYFEREFGQLSRPNPKGWMMARAGCCFHFSESKKSFFVHIDGGYCCFGCGAKGGSLIDFVMQRDRVDFKTAAKSLGAWRDEGLTELERREIDRQAAARRQERDKAEKAKADQQAATLTLRDEIHVTADIQRRVSGRLSELRGGSAENRQDEQGTCWAILALALDDLRLTESAYMKACGLEDPYDTTEVFA
jgi:hypothetical protein